jgi:hypothetical protein
MGLIYIPTLFDDVQIGWNTKLLLPLILKNGSVGDIAFSSKEEIFPKSPLAWF